MHHTFLSVAICVLVCILVNVSFQGEVGGGERGGVCVEEMACGSGQLYTKKVLCTENVLFSCVNSSETSSQIALLTTDPGVNFFHQDILKKSIQPTAAVYSSKCINS